jgi:hypothetical protein
LHSPVVEASPENKHYAWVYGLRYVATANWTTMS